MYRLKNCASPKWSSISVRDLGLRSAASLSVSSLAIRIDWKSSERWVSKFSFKRIMNRVAAKITATFLKKKTTSDPSFSTRCDCRNPAFLDKPTRLLCDLIYKKLIRTTGELKEINSFFTFCRRTSLLMPCRLGWEARGSPGPQIASQPSASTSRETRQVRPLGEKRYSTFARLRESTNSPFNLSFCSFANASTGTPLHSSLLSCLREIPTILAFWFSSSGESIATSQRVVAMSSTWFDGCVERASLAAKDKDATLLNAINAAKVPKKIYDCFKNHPL